MIVCRHIENRVVPIDYNDNELFEQKFTESFFLCLIYSGYAVLEIDNQRHYVGQGSLVCLPKGIFINRIASNQLKAISISFQPKFINVNLDWDTITATDFIDKAIDLEYPRFELFLYYTDLYKGILPISNSYKKSLYNSFNFIIKQLTEQPDIHWSCRSRDMLFSIFKAIEPLYQMFINSNKSNFQSYSTTTSRKIINYIHANLANDLSINNLCNLFLTNHTTLLKEFKEYTGSTINNYIFDQRLYLVKQALAFTNLTVQDIAISHGFKSSSYLSTVFKKNVGLTPIEYRKQMRLKRVKKIDE